MPAHAASETTGASQIPVAPIRDDMTNKAAPATSTPLPIESAIPYSGRSTAEKYVAETTFTPMKMYEI
jgi:hypothetical protein